MDKIVIEGGRPLEGTVKMSGAKNAVLPILAATLLTRGRNIIEGVPKVRDVATMIQLLKDLGAEWKVTATKKLFWIHPVQTILKHLMIWFLQCGLPAWYWDHC